jgi:hypothetical protein
LATEVAFIVMVRVMAALSVVVVAIAAARFAIFGVIAALLVGVLGLVAMNVARFAGKLRWSLPLELVAFIVAVTRCYSRDRDCDRRDNCECARYGICRPCSSSCCHTCSWQSLAELHTFCGLTVRAESLACRCSFNIVEQFEVFRDGFDRLVDKSLSGPNKLIAL